MISALATTWTNIFSILLLRLRQLCSCCNDPPAFGTNLRTISPLAMDRRSSTAARSDSGRSSRPSSSALIIRDHPPAHSSASVPLVSALTTPGRALGTTGPAAAPGHLSSGPFRRSREGYLHRGSLCPATGPIEDSIQSARRIGSSDPPRHIDDGQRVHCLLRTEKVWVGWCAPGRKGGRRRLVGPERSRELMLRVFLCVFSGALDAHDIPPVQRFDCWERRGRLDGAELSRSASHTALHCEAPI